MKYKGITINKSSRRIVAQQCVAGRLVFIASLPMPYEWEGYTGNIAEDAKIFAKSPLSASQAKLPQCLNKARFEERSEQLARIRDNALFYWMQEEADIDFSRLNFPEDYGDPNSLPKQLSTTLKFVEKAKGLSMLSGRSVLKRTVRDLEERIKFLENHLFSKQKTASPSSGKYRGTSFFNGKWVARIMIRGKAVRLGAFRTEREAAAAYDEAKVKHGVSGSLNFPEDYAPLVQTESKQWKAQIILPGIGLAPIGEFSTRESAVEAYNSFARENELGEIK